jgi:RHS repeat-associated protein
MSDAQPMGTVTYTYDAYGRRLTMSWPDGGLTLGYQFNDADELTALTQNSASLISFGYDSYGRRQQITRANGANTTYGYDSNLRLSSIVQPFNSTTLAYTAAGQIKSSIASLSAMTYAPVAKSTAYTANGLNQYSAVAGSALSYDSRGNLTGESGGTYTYNANNLLLTATQSGVTSTLTYDAENRLLSVAKNGNTTQFLYDGSDIIAEYNGTGSLLRRYVHGPGESEPLVWYEGTTLGTRYFLHTNAVGSIVGATNNAGTVLNTTAYDDYGGSTSSNSGYASRFGFTGQAWLPEIGMYYYRARLYSPALGRFMQVDPLGYSQGLNVYNYVHGDPINRTDPSGLQDDTTVTVQGQRPDCSSYGWWYSSHCASLWQSQQNGGWGYTRSDVVNSFFFSGPLTLAWVGQMQNCPAPSGADPKATTSVDMPNGSSVDLPAQDDNSTFKYSTVGFDAVAWVGFGVSGGTFTYNAVNGNIIQGTYVSYYGGGGSAMSISGGGGRSQGPGQFFGPTTNFNPSVGPISGSIGRNSSGYNAGVTFSKAKFGWSAAVTESNTVPVGEIKSIGCWSKK